MSAIGHLDIVVTSPERTLDLYRGLLEPLGSVRASEIEGERGAVVESGPEEYDHSPGCYAVFFHDPDPIKLEIVHRSSESDLVAEVRRLTARLERREREQG